MRGKFSTATNILSAGVLAAHDAAAPAMSQEETIKVGVLHSLSERWRFRERR